MAEQYKSANSHVGCAVFAVLLTAVVGVTLSWNWYRAGVQAEVYWRQGVEMSQWEVFLGSKPAERTINLK